MKDYYFSIAIHEAAHQVCADLRGVSAYAEITPDGISKLMNQTTPNTGGACWFSHEPKPFISAIISWSGVLAEALWGEPEDFFPPFRPSPKLLRDWYSMTTQQLHRLSETDRRGINGYRNSWLSCRSAFVLVSKNKTRIVRLAKCLAAAKVAADAAEAARIEQAKWQGVPRPPAFPVSHSDYLRLICGNNVERFEQFIVSRAAMHLTNNRTDKIEEAKNALGDLFTGAYEISLTFVRQLYGSDIKMEQEWLTRCREFQTWDSEHK